MLLLIKPVLMYPQELLLSHAQLGLQKLLSDLSSNWSLLIGSCLHQEIIPPQVRLGVDGGANFEGQSLFLLVQILSFFCLMPAQSTFAKLRARRTVQLRGDRRIAGQWKLCLKRVRCYCSDFEQRKQRDESCRHNVAI